MVSCHFHNEIAFGEQACVAINGNVVFVSLVGQWMTLALG